MIPAATNTTKSSQKSHYSSGCLRKWLRNLINAYSWVYTRYRFIKSFLRFTFHSIPKSWELAKIIWLKKREHE